MQNNQTVLITGATSGIGYELSKIFIRNKYNVVFVARNQKALERAKEALTSQYDNSTITCISADLSQPDSPQEIYAKLQKEGITINILVNSAGFGVYGDFTTVDINKHLNLLWVNVIALTALTRLFLPDMLRRKQGKILNIASTAAFQPGPHMAVYYASKAYVLSFSEAL